MRASRAAHARARRRAGGGGAAGACCWAARSPGRRRPRRTCTLPPGPSIWRAPSCRRCGPGWSWSATGSPNSTMAYQGYGLGADRALIAGLTRLLPIQPALTILLQVSPGIGAGADRAPAGPRRPLRGARRRLPRPGRGRLRGACRRRAVADRRPCRARAAVEQVQARMWDAVAAAPARDASRARTRTCSATMRPRRAFAAALAGSRLHHAWLITGPEGIGKATLAYRFARRLLTDRGRRRTIRPTRCSAASPAARMPTC